MPFTLLHYLQAYIIWLMLRRKYPLHILVLSSMLPDLEVPLVYALSSAKIIVVSGYSYVDRLVLHSIFGGIVIVPILTVVLSPVYLRVLRLLGIECSCTSIRVKLGLGALGGVGHVLIDATHHEYNPLLYPFTTRSIDVLVPWGNALEASIIAHLVFATACLVIVLKYYVESGGCLKKTIALLLNCSSRY